MASVYSSFFSQTENAPYGSKRKSEVAHSEYQPQTATGNSMQIFVQEVQIAGTAWVPVGFIKGHRVFEIKSVISRNPEDDYQMISLNHSIIDNHTVQRRFSDFELLRNKLVRNNMECIVPPLPDKAVFKNLFANDDDLFVQGRIKGLEFFLVRLRSHQVLRESPELFRFLTQIDKPYQDPSDNSDYSYTYHYIQKPIWGGQRYLSEVLKDYSLFHQTSKAYSTVIGDGKTNQGQVSKLKSKQEADYTINLGNGHRTMNVKEVENSHQDPLKLANMDKRYEEFTGTARLLDKYIGHLCSQFNLRSLNDDKVSVCNASVLCIYTKLEELMDKNSEKRIDQEQKAYVLSRFQDEVQFQQQMSLFLKEQVEESLQYYKKYLECLEEQILQRETMKSTMLKHYASFVSSGLFKSKKVEHMDEIQQQRKLLKKITQGHIEEFEMLHCEISNSIVTCLKLLGNNYYILQKLSDPSLACSEFQPQQTPSGLKVLSIEIFKVEWHQVPKTLTGRGGYRLYSIRATIKGRAGAGGAVDYDEADKEERVSEVSRRFKDFENLQWTLTKFYPECFVPPLAKKSLQDKIVNDDSSFVDKRKRSLLMFLFWTADHPVFGQSLEFEQFLTPTRGHQHERSIISQDLNQTSLSQNESVEGSEVAQSQLSNLDNKEVSKTPNGNQTAQGQSNYSIQSIWSRVTGRIKSSTSGSANATQMISNTQSGYLIDIKLEQEYQVQVIAGSHMLSHQLEVLYDSLKTNVRTLEKQTQAMARISTIKFKSERLSHSPQKGTDSKSEAGLQLQLVINSDVKNAVEEKKMEGLSVQVQVKASEVQKDQVEFYTDEDSIHEDMVNLTKCNHELMMTFRNKLMIESVGFFIRYLKSIQQSAQNRQELIEEFKRCQDRLPQDQELQQRLKIREITRCHLEEFATFSRNMGAQIVRAVNLLGDKYTHLISE